MYVLCKKIYADVCVEEGGSGIYSGVCFLNRLVPEHMSYLRSYCVAALKL